MSVDPMNNESITIDHIYSEQNHHVDNQQNDIKSKEVVSRIQAKKKTPMTPTRLYVSYLTFSIIIKCFLREYSWWSQHPTEMIIGAFVLFTILTIIVGIIIVCLTQPKPSGMIVLF
jgi:hypothetical protein